MKASRTSRLAGLALALALSVIALGATVAHAEIGSEWRVNGSAVNDTLHPQLQITELETLPATGVKEGILLTKTGLTTVEVLCTAMKLVDALLQLLGVVLGKAHYEGCITKLNKGAAAGACKPHSPGAAEGLIETNFLIGLIKLHQPVPGEKVAQLEVIPEGSSLFVTLKMGKEVGSECAIGAEFGITGTIFLRTSTFGEIQENLVVHLFQEGALSALLDGGNPATIAGSAKVALIAPHAGMTWSGQPG